MTSRPWLPLLLVWTMLTGCREGADDAGENRAPTTTGPSPVAPTFAATSAPAFPVTLSRAADVLEITRTDLKVGKPPKVEYVVWDGGRQVVVTPEGTIAATLEVGRMGNEGYRHLSFAPYSDGWLTGFDFMGLIAVLVGRDGQMGRELGYGPEGVFSRADRREIAFTFAPWDGVRSVVATLGPSGVQRYGPARRCAGFLSPHEVIIATAHGVFRVDTRDRSRTQVPGLSGAWMVSSRTGLLIGESAAGHGIHDVRTAQPVLGSPTYQLLAFNPSGEIVVGVRAKAGRTTLVLAAARTGEVRQAFRWRSQSPPDELVWEDDRSLLVVTAAGLTRLRTDGTAELARLHTGEPGYVLLPPLVS